MEPMDARSSLKRYARVWKQMVIMNFATYSASRIEFICYLAGKLLRMGFFFVFVFALFSKTTSLMGYSKGEVLLFFATVNTLDIGLQLFYRGLTQVPNSIRNGDVDLVLNKPISPFFALSFRIFDVYDLMTIPPSIFFLGYAIHLLPFSLSAEQIALGIFFWFIALFLSYCLNIIFAACAFWITEIENGIWLYRDMVYMGRFPAEIFPAGVRAAFTIFIPILVITNFPVKALLGRLTWTEGIWGCAIALIIGYFTYALWNKALRHYTSASS